MNYKNILQLIPLAQSKKILQENINLTKRKNKSLVGSGIKSIIGIELTKETANIIGGIK